MTMTLLERIMATSCVWAFISACLLAVSAKTDCENCSEYTPLTYALFGLFILNCIGVVVPMTMEIWGVK